MDQDSEPETGVEASFGLKSCTRRLVSQADSSDPDGPGLLGQQSGPLGVWATQAVLAPHPAALAHEPPARRVCAGAMPRSFENPRFKALHPSKYHPTLAPPLIAKQWERAVRKSDPPWVQETHGNTIAGRALKDTAAAWAPTTLAPAAPKIWRTTYGARFGDQG